MKITIALSVLSILCSCKNREQNTHSYSKVSNILECTLRKNGKWGCDALILKRFQTDSSIAFTYFDQTGKSFMEFNDYDTLKGLDRTILKFISKKSISIKNESPLQ